MLRRVIVDVVVARACGKSAGTFVERTRIPQWQADCIGIREIITQLEERRDVNISTFPSLPQSTPHPAQNLHPPGNAPRLNTLESLKDLTISSKLGNVGLF